VPREGKKRNVIVLLLDTMRASALAEHGLPNISRLSRKGTLYANAIAPGTWSPPSHASVFTGMPVSRIRGVSKDFFAGGTKSIDPWMVKTRFLSDGTETLASRIGSLGYQTALFSNNPFLTSFTNLGMGFEHIDDIWLRSNLKYNRGLVQKLSPIINGGASAREKMFKVSYLMTRVLPPSLLDWVYLYFRRKLNEGVCNADGTYRSDRGAKDTLAAIRSYFDYRYNYSPQFMFINYMEAHENYPVPRNRGIVQDKWLYLSGIEEMSKDVVAELYAGYLKRLRYLDGAVGKTLDVMRSRGVLDHATVVVTSDHGQFFGEHGLLYHSLKPYESIARVPLIATNFDNGRISGEPEVVGENVSLRSLNDGLVGIANGSRDRLNGDMGGERYVVSEHTGISEGWDEEFLRMLKPRSKSADAIYRAKSRCNQKATAVYKGGMKLIHNFGRARDELYDVHADPEERHNLIGSRRGVALELAGALAGSLV
jgi:arylsulfatase A-like enzyme